MSIFRSGKYWYYVFQSEGTKHRGGGFDTEEKASKAEAEHRQETERQQKMSMTPHQFLGYLRDYGRLIAKEYYDPQNIIKANPVTLGELAVAYFDSKGKETSDNEWHKNKIRRFLRQFDDWKDIEAESIMREDVRRHRDRVASEISNDAANKDLALIKSIFRWGVEEGYVKQTPCLGIRPLPWERKERYIPSDHDVLEVQKYLPTVWGWIYIVVKNTGARMRSVSRLMWNDIIFEDPNPKIQWGSIVLKHYKSKGGKLRRHKLPMTEELYFTLRHVFAQRDKSNPYVFPSPKKTREQRVKFQPVIKKACKDARVPYFSWQCLRHYAATKLLKMGYRIEVIQRVLGHSNKIITERYLEPIEDQLAEAMYAYGREIEEKTPTSKTDDRRSTVYKTRS